MGQADIFNPFVSPLPPATVCIPQASFESVLEQILKSSRRTLWTPGWRACLLGRGEGRFSSSRLKESRREFGRAGRWRGAPICFREAAHPSPARPSCNARPSAFICVCFLA